MFECEVELVVQRRRVRTHSGIITCPEHRQVNEAVGPHTGRVAVCVALKNESVFRRVQMCLCVFRIGWDLTLGDRYLDPAARVHGRYEGAEFEPRECLVLR